MGRPCFRFVQVRMADYMLVESSVDLLTDSMEIVHQVFTDHAVFITAASFTEEGVLFSPTDEEVMHDFNNKVVEQTIQMTKKLPRILEEKNFIMLFEQPMPRGPDPTAIIVSNRALNNARRSCDMIVKKSFQKAEEYASVLEEVGRGGGAGGRREGSCLMLVQLRGGLLRGIGPLMPHSATGRSVGEDGAALQGDMGREGVSRRQSRRAGIPPGHDAAQAVAGRR